MNEQHSFTRLRDTSVTYYSFGTGLHISDVYHYIKSGNGLVNKSQIVEGLYDGPVIVGEMDVEFSNFWFAVESAIESLIVEGIIREERPNVYEVVD